MSSYTIAEEFTLPSLGKIYDGKVPERVKIRSMTTEDEMKRLAPTDRPNKLLCEIIDDCLVDDIGISSYDMCIGDQQFLLHKMRVVTYGQDYNVRAVCPYCGCSTETVVDLESLAVHTYEDSLEKYFEFDLPVTKHHIRLKLQTPHMLDTIQNRAKEIKDKFPEMRSDPAVLFMIEYMIDSVDHDKLTEKELDELVRNLPMKDTNYILQCAKKLNDLIGEDKEFTIKCSVCGLDYRSPFRITSEFFGPTIDA